MNDLLSEFTAKYGEELAGLLELAEFKEDFQYEYSGESGVTLVSVGGDEWRSFLSSKGWYDLGEPPESLIKS